MATSPTAELRALDHAEATARATHARVIDTLGPRRPGARVDQRRAAAEETAWQTLQGSLAAIDAERTEWRAILAARGAYSTV